jgi:hypothetical protein
MYQFPHQSYDALTREDIADALSQAEFLVAKTLGYFPAPKEVSEKVLYPRSGNYAYGQLWYGASGRYKSIQTRFNKIISVGQYTYSQLSAGAAVTGSDTWGDGFNSTWSCTVGVPAGTTAEEIRVYFTVADRLSIPFDKAEIRPVSVTIAGNNATITGHMSQLVKPALYMQTLPDKLDITGSIFVSHVAIFRAQIDTTLSGNLIWRNFEGMPPCDGETDEPCQVEMTSACFQATDREGGWIAPIPAEYDATLQQWKRVYPDWSRFAPDEVILNYISGVPLLDGKVEMPFARIVALLATALLPNRSCGCQRADLRIVYYRSIPQDDDGKLLVMPSLMERASYHFGVAGRGALQALELITPQIINYRSAHA